MLRYSSLQPLMHSPQHRWGARAEGWGSEEGEGWGSGEEEGWGWAAGEDSGLAGADLD